MNVAELLRGHADRDPDGIALLDVHGGRDRRITFGRLEQSAGQASALLSRSGLHPGDTALVFHRMSAELYVSLAALLQSGVTAMFADPSAGRHYLERCCRLVPPSALIASPACHLLRWICPALRRIPHRFSIGRRWPGTIAFPGTDQTSSDRDRFTGDGGMPALLSFTSGVGGEPKAVPRTHRFLLAQQRALTRALRLEPGEIELVTLPMFVLANLGSGVTSLIPNSNLRRPELIAAAPVVDQIIRHRATRAAAPPACLERIAEHCERKRITLPGLKRIHTGGGPVPPRLLKRLEQIAPQAEIMLVYGSTEAEPIATVSVHEMDQTDRSKMAAGCGLLVGHPVPEIEVRILDDAGRAAGSQMTRETFDQYCRPAGKGGEIVVAGEHVLSGYLHGWGDHDNKLRVDGEIWHRTGDDGFLDARGRLWLLGRREARIEDSRGRFYPLGAEQWALEHGCVRRAAVVSRRGRRVLAVELRRHARPADVRCLCRRLASVGIDTLRIVKRMPVDRRHNSKIDYPALRALLEERGCV